MDGKHRFRKLALRLVFFALLGWAVALVRAVRPRRGWEDWSEDEREWTPTPAPVAAVVEEPKPARRPFRSHRLVTSFGLVAVFFAAATFTAGAGDMISKALDPARCAALMQATGEDESICAQVAQEEALQAAQADAEQAAAEAAEAAPEAAAPEAAPEALPGSETAAPDAAAEPSSETASVDAESAPADQGETAEAASAEQADATAPAAAPAPEAEEELILAPTGPSAKPAKGSSRHWVVRRAKERRTAPVEHEGGAATIWLNRELGDPTPPAKRLSPRFAKNLQRISAVNGVSWALVLGVLRAEGARDRTPATIKELNALARGLAARGAASSEWSAALALSGRTGFADRAVALARYNRVVGLDALVRGLEAAKPRLTQQLLNDQRADIYSAGRDDLEQGKIDVRTVVVISYLAESFGQVTVSSLFSGHRKYARPGVVSAHIYGHAVDIASVANTPIMGHQQPGSITEKAVRSILMLPVELQPRQVISLIGMGGPSFPLANHDDHIHVGF
jgi:murein DD-endopeptidase MepM/ murein hydrolase activator NlpD